MEGGIGETLNNAAEGSKGADAAFLREVVAEMTSMMLASTKTKNRIPN